MISNGMGLIDNARLSYTSLSANPHAVCTHRSLTPRNRSWWPCLHHDLPMLQKCTLYIPPPRCGMTTTVEPRNIILRESRKGSWLGFPVTNDMIFEIYNKATSLLAALSRIKPILLYSAMRRYFDFTKRGSPNSSKRKLINDVTMEM